MDDFVRFMDKMMLEEITQEADRENIIKTTIENCIKYKKFPKIIRDSKNEEIAEKEIGETNKSIATAPLEKLIESYNRAIAYALPNSNLLARAYANRSAALTNGELYEDSLKDIERALEIGYPDNLKAKLYARKAKNLLALNRKMCSEVREAIDQAKLWVEQMDDDDINKKKVLNNLNQLKTNKLIKKSVKKWDSSVFLPKIPNDNPKILRASGSIDIQRSEKFGRHIVATKDIKAGEIIMVHKFYAFILRSEYRYRYCWNCSKYVCSGVPCNQCANVMYCNEKCRDIAWQEHHDLECPAITTILHSFTQTDEIIGGLRLLVKALKEFGTIDGLYEKIQEINSIDDSIMKCFTGDIYDDTKYASVYSLLRLKSMQFFTQVTSFLLVKILTILSATTEILGKKYDNPAEIINNRWIFFVCDLIFKHVEIMDTNGLDMPTFDRKGNPVAACGWFLAPLLDLFSHSCDRNIYPLTDGDFEALITVRPINKGEQLCISYGPYYRELPVHERRPYIHQRFKFWCECIACVNGWGPTFQHSSCLKKFLKTAKKDVIKAFEKYNKHVPTFTSSIVERTWDVSSNTIIQMIADTTALLNIIGGDKYPCKEIIELKFVLIEIFNYIREYTSII